MKQQSDELLRALIREDVEFVIVGGVAAVLHGSSHLTKDLDVVAPLTVENCRKILAALGPLSPKFYQSFGKPPLTRTAEDLARFKNIYLITDLGIIDLLGSLPPVGDYEKVAAHSEAIHVFGLACRVISIDDLIEVKHYVGRPKDKHVELELRAIRERLRDTKKSSD